jgi:hypothetical protein
LGRRWVQIRHDDSGQILAHGLAFWDVYIGHHNGMAVRLLHPSLLSLLILRRVDWVKRLGRLLSLALDNPFRVWLLLIAMSALRSSSLALALELSDIACIHTTVVGGTRQLASELRDSPYCNLQAPTCCYYRHLYPQHQPNPVP